MQTSQETNLIDSAMVEIQKELKHAVLDKTSTHNNYAYASLESIIDATRLIAAKNGVSIQQYPEFDGDMHVLVTRIAHKSGQFYISKIKLIIGKLDMQGLGSAITYSKRYVLASIFAIATGEGDDDGQATVAQPRKEAATAVQEQKPASFKISDAQKNFISQSFAKDGRSLEKMLNHFNIKSIDEMTKIQVEAVINDIKGVK